MTINKYRNHLSNIVPGFETGEKQGGQFNKNGTVFKCRNREFKKGHLEV